MTIRSGRFIGDATGSGINIISAREGTYRIFNSGIHPFDVRESGVKVLTIPVDCSADLRPMGPISINATKNVDGIYDHLTEHATIRSGRFSLLSGALQIVNKAKGSGFYRLLNSGSNPFNVDRGGTTVVSLTPKMTIDVEFKNNDDLSIASLSAIEGIYFHLNQIAAVKSGRFKIDPRVPTTPADPLVPHTIIDKITNKGAFYRIFNSGAFPFNLTGVAASPIEIKPSLSFDFNIDSTNTVVQVVGLIMDNPIEGIYDYLGDE